MNTYYHFQRRKLKSWYSIIIETDKENESKYVFFTSKIHKTKKLKLPISFSLEFTDQQILNDRDLGTQLYRRYGTDITE